MHDEANSGTLSSSATGDATDATLRGLACADPARPRRSNGRQLGMTSPGGG
jgi:hypothetical protein